MEQNQTITKEQSEVVSPTLKYCLYARKSTEDDERQALSIDSQIKEMQEMADRAGIKVAEIRKESHSAKVSGTRPIFNQLMEDVEKGEFQAILTWAPDRLSRNGGDLGLLIDLMDKKLLHEIKTHSQVFTDSPNDKFMLMILGSQAKLENDNRGINVKRGQRAKCEQGWRPGSAPLGYLNEKGAGRGKEKIFLDPERAPILRECFEKVAYQGYSCRETYKWITRQTNFTTRQGKAITLSSLHRVLTSPFYYGEFEYPAGTGKWYKGAHKPIINKQLFNEVQALIKISHEYKYGVKEFQFTRLIKCGQCGSGITAYEKFKKFKNGTIRRYVYYSCTKNRNIDCKQPQINEKDLIEQFVRIINKVDLNKIKLSKKVNAEIERYQRFAGKFLGSEQKIKIPKINLRNYARYILREGQRDEKRELLNCLCAQLYLDNREISIN